MKTFLHVAACVLLFAFSTCAAKKDIRSQPELEPSTAAGDGLSVFQTGSASWYGDDFNGKATADGEIYDMHKLTAAHQNLPFHTLVEVENLENKKKVLVRINDRGPFLKNRIIDLSLQAAQRLEMIEKGTAEVNIRVLRWGGIALDGGSSLNGCQECYVQAGAFSIRENAEDMLLTLNEILPDLAFRIALESGMFKIISQKLTSALACREAIKKLAAYHLEGFIREMDVQPEN